MGSKAALLVNFDIEENIYPNSATQRRIRHLLYNSASFEGNKSIWFTTYQKVFRQTGASVVYPLTGEWTQLYQVHFC